MKPKSRRNILVALTLAIIVTAGLIAAYHFPTKPSQPPVTAPARPMEIIDHLRKTIDRLRNIKIADDDPAIPAPVRPLLTELKHGLRDLIQVTLNDHSAPWQEPAAVAERILTTLQRHITFIHNPASRDEAAPYSYGEINAIEIVQPVGYRDLLVATTTLGVVCGNDISFYLFRRMAGEWQLVVEQESNDYDTISGAQGAFQYAVSPAVADEFFMVTTNVNPWCTSNWQSLRYRVFRVGARPDQPQLLLAKRETIWLGNDDYGVISIEPERFQIAFDAYQELDAGVLIRKHILTYAVRGGQVSRLAPLAIEPAGFLDEWFQLPWSKARQWLDLTHESILRQWHGRLNAQYSAEVNTVSTSFVFDPPACQTAPERWQVGIDFSPGYGATTLPAGFPSEIYFTIDQKDESYRLVNVAASAESSCRGNLIDTTASPCLMEREK
jgi:hypothetical protein